MSKAISEVLHPGMRGAFYGRVSTDEQNVDGQLSTVLEFVRRYDCDIVSSYIDDGVSSTKKSLEKREQLNQLISDSYGNAFDFVCVYRDDRLARNPLEHETIRLTLRMIGKPIIIAATGLLYDEPDIVTRLAKDGITAFEVATIKQRTRDALRSIVRKGIWPGRAPYGYEYQKDTYTFKQIEEELFFVREIFRLYETGLGCKRIATSLPPNSYRGKNWSRDAVERIVTNPFYCGYLVWGRSTTERKRKPFVLDSLNTDESIIMVRSDRLLPSITKQQFDRCWNLFMQRSQREIDPHFFTTDALLRDYLFCKPCDVAMKIDNQRTQGKRYGERFYHCPNCNNAHNPKELEDKIKGFIIQKLRNQTGLLRKALERDIHRLSEDKVVMTSKLQSQLDEYEMQSKVVQKKIQELYRQERDEVALNTIKCLILLRQDLTRRIDDTNARLSECESGQEKLRAFGCLPRNLESVLQQLHENPSKYSQMDWRRIVAGLIHRMDINRHGHMTISFAVSIEDVEVSSIRSYSLETTDFVGRF